MRGPDISVSGFKIDVFGQKFDTFSATRADPIFPFHDLKSMFLVKNGGPDFSVSRLKIHVLSQKLDTFFATRAELIFAFHAIKSMFLVKN